MVGFGTATDTETVRLGLEALVRHAAYQRLRTLLGTEPKPRDVPRRRKRKVAGSDPVSRQQASIRSRGWTRRVEAVARSSWPPTGRCCKRSPFTTRRSSRSSTSGIYTACVVGWIDIHLLASVIAG